MWNGLTCMSTVLQKQRKQTDDRVYDKSKAKQNAIVRMDNKMLYFIIVYDFP